MSVELDDKELNKPELEEELEVLDDDAEVDDTDDVDLADSSDDEEDIQIHIEGEESAASEEEDEPPEVTGSALVKKLRKEIEERNKQIRERDDKIKTFEVKTEPELPKLGDKPTLESCDFDADVFEQKLDQWKADKATLEQAEVQKTEQKKKEAEYYQGRLASYETSKKTLGIKGIEESEKLVRGTLDIMQQGIIIAYVDEPAKLVAALGANPKVLTELASIKDPVQYAFKVAAITGKIKMTTTKKAPAPETKLRGDGKVTGSADKKLEALRAAAEKSGNFTEVVAYKRKMRDAKK